ncbi:MAG TPA: indoleacetamide hydrolase [Stellaceae bacterium]
MELAELTLTEAARSLRDGDVTAEAYAAALLDRGAALARLNAFIAQDRDAVLVAARAADLKRRDGGELGALHGVPLAIKDNLDCVGYATTGGTPALRHHRPRHNAPVVQTLLDAGAIVLGKANMHELAFGITNNNAAFGPARNPYDPSRIPGGSSGGTGAAIGAWLAPAGIGTDTGGSVRIPAALCGIVGLRPSLGRWPQAGILPISHTRDTAGPMTRDVADCVLLDAVVTGGNALLASHAAAALRLGVPRQFFCEPLDDEVARLFEAFLGALRAAGVTLIEVDLHAAQALNNRAGGPISRYEARHDIAAYFADHGIDLGFDDLVERIAGPDVKAILAGSRHFTEADYRQALIADRPALQELYADCMTRHGLTALIFPTTPLPAATIGEDDTTMMNGRPVPTFATFARNTGPGSVAGLPGLALPIGLTAAGLPVGIELDGPPGSDRGLLAAGLTLERIAGPLPGPRL